MQRRTTICFLYSYYVLGKSDYKIIERFMAIQTVKSHFVFSKTNLINVLEACILDLQVTVNTFIRSFYLLSFKARHEVSLKKILTKNSIRVFIISLTKYSNMGKEYFEICIYYVTVTFMLPLVGSTVQS